MRTRNSEAPYVVLSESEQVIALSLACTPRRNPGAAFDASSDTPVPAVLFHHGGDCADVSEAPRTLDRRFAARGYAFLWLYRRGAGASRRRGECGFAQIPRVRTHQGDEAALKLQLELLTTTELADAMAGLVTLRTIPGIDAPRSRAAPPFFVLRSSAAARKLRAHAPLTE